MITVTNTEFNNIFNSTKDIFKHNVKNTMDLANAGFNNNINIINCCIELNNLEALKSYETEDYQAESYFNVISSNDVSNIYSNTNIITK